MKYAGAVAAIFWAWHRGGFTLPPGTSDETGRWIYEQHLDRALEEFKVWSTLQVDNSSLPSTSDDLEKKESSNQIVPVDGVGFLRFGFNPENGREIAYKAIDCIIAVWDELDFYEVSRQILKYEFFLLLFAIAAYAHDVDDDVPITKEDIHNVCSRIDEHIQGAPEEDPNISQIAWRILRLSPSGRALDAILDKKKVRQLPPLDQILVGQIEG